MAPVHFVQPGRVLLGAAISLAVSASSCGLVGSSTSFADVTSADTTGGSASTLSNGGRTNAIAGGGNAFGGAGLMDAGEADAGCYRDPYLPDNYQPPCEQPKAVPNCTNGWCTVEPGCFIMGDSWCQWYRARFMNDPTQVTLTRRFRIQQFEVTQKQWTAEGLPNLSGLFADGTGDCLASDCPVGNVSWLEVLAFANLLSQNEGLSPCYVLENCQGEIGSGFDCGAVHSTHTSIYDCPGYRLPTGAEWEYAARAGTKTTVYTGDILDTGHVPFTCYDEPVLLPIAWYCANAGLYTHPVGQKFPNDWGLYDVIGNAVEWTGSVAATYGQGPFIDWGAELSISDLHDPNFSIMQTRGEHWYEWPNSTRVGNQGGSGALFRIPGTGFRLVQTLVR